MQCCSAASAIALSPTAVAPESNQPAVPEMGMLRVRVPYAVLPKLPPAGGIDMSSSSRPCYHRLPRCNKDGLQKNVLEYWRHHPGGMPATSRWSRGSFPDGGGGQASCHRPTQREAVSFPWPKLLRFSPIQSGPEEATSMNESPRLFGSTGISSLKKQHHPLHCNLPTFLML